MAALTLTVESSENLGPAEVAPLEVGSAELVAAELIRLHVLDTTQELPGEQRERAVSAALDAFEKGHFLMVVDDRRVTDSNEMLRLGDETRVRFWRLVPLAGG